MPEENDSPVGGRLTLGAVGGLLLLLGAIPLYLGLNSPSGAGLSDYGIGLLLGVVGVALIAVAVINPDALEIGTRTTPSEGEKYARRVEDPTEDE